MVLLVREGAEGGSGGGGDDEVQDWNHDDVTVCKVVGHDDDAAMLI